MNRHDIYVFLWQFYTDCDSIQDASESALAGVNLQPYSSWNFTQPGDEGCTPGYWKNHVDNNTTDGKPINLS